MKWEMVVGLETHIELSTKTKIFCGCTTAFGGEPNTHCCPVCTGQPGALPVLNRQAVEYAVMAGLALGCSISRVSMADRKHYVYPDLPKAFQISQYDKPFCLGGKMTLSNGRTIGITRIHLEEDAGKLIHERGNYYVDYNRGGVPLIEIVSEPDFREIDEVIEYLERLQSIMRYLGVSDCRMQEGSLRCDVNLSLRAPGSSGFGTRTETKNLNSFSAVRAALSYEYERQSEILDAGGTVEQETLHFDAATGETRNMRGKENADDYRYFREPDLPGVLITQEDIERLRARIPELPQQKAARYVAQFGLTEDDAALLCRYRAVAEYFERVAAAVKEPKTAAALILTQMFSAVPTESERERWAVRVSDKQLVGLIALLEAGKINRNLAKNVLALMLERGEDAESVLRAEGISTEESLDLPALCRAAMEAAPAAVADYRAGKQKALQALIGQVMRQSRGRADAGAVRETLLQLLG